MKLALRDNFFDIIDGLDHNFFLDPSSLGKLSNSKADPIKVIFQEDDKNYYVRAVVPGFSQEEIDITVNNRRINISGKKERVSEGADLFSSSQTSFQQSYHLPTDSVPDNISAEMDNGILVVSIPKWKPDSKSDTRKIPVGKPPPLT